MQLRSRLHAVLVGAALTACGGGGSTAAPKTVNDITITAKQLSVPLTTYDVGNYSFQSVLVGNGIYIANYSNTGKTQFFVRYDLGSNSFSSPLATSSNFCGCGYTSKLVSDGTNVFYVANDATKYTASSNAWSNMNYPSTAHDNAGEAGVTHYAGNIYFVGGRTPSTLFKYYSIAQDGWFTLPNYLYPTSEPELAVYKDRIYALGGTGTAQRMAYFSTSSGTWTALRDTPFAVVTSYESEFAAVLGDHLFLLQGQGVWVYDLVKDEWATEPVTLGNLSLDEGELYSNGSKLYVSGKNTSNVPQVFELTVGTR